LKENDYTEDLDVDGRIILKGILRNMFWGRGVVSCEPG